MLACRACSRRALNALFSLNTLSEPSILLPATRHVQQFRPRVRASYTTAVVVDVEPAQPLEDPERTLAAKKRQKHLEWVVQKHLQYMEDPFKIASHVEQTLRKDRFDEALLLTQTASKDKQCTVAWNHLIDYQMNQQKLHSAIKLFNEMKKRGQLPDARTFTIVFRGCAKSQHTKLAVSEAVRLYHSLLNDKRLQPNSIHMNAVLQVCGRAGDLDSMFAIANTVDKRMRAPTAYTYTIIINSLRAKVESQEYLKDLSVEQRDETTKKTIQQCKQVWEEVVRHWRNGILVIDEELVCAMGRVLLLGDNADRLEVLVLLEQTMSIRRLDRDNLNLESAPDGDRKMLDKAMKGIALSGPSKYVSGSKIVYAVPGGNTLSLLLTALRKQRHVHLALAYWDVFVDFYGLRPDADNWHQLLRLLRIGKSTSRAVKMLEQMPDELKTHATFRIAMSTAIRDNMNANVFQLATTIVDSMLDHFKEPDVVALRMYLRVALVCHHQFRMMALKGEELEGKRAYGQQIIAALDRLWGPLDKIIKVASVPEVVKGLPKSKHDAKKYNDLREVVALARKMLGAADKVITERMATEEELAPLINRRNSLNRWVVGFFDKREAFEPKLRRKGGLAKRRVAFEEESSDREDEGEDWNTSIRVV